MTSSTHAPSSIWVSSPRRPLPSRSPREPATGPRRRPKCLADGVVIAKEAFRFVEQSQAYHGTKEAFRLRDEHFRVPEPGSP